MNQTAYRIAAGACIVLAVLLALSPLIYVELIF